MLTTEDFARIQRAVRILGHEGPARPDLARVAADSGLREDHFQALFHRWAGVSPTRLLQIATAERMNGASMGPGAHNDAAPSRTSRLDDLVVEVRALTGGEAKSKGEGLEIAWGFHPTPFGEALIGVTPLGICDLAFIAPEEIGKHLADLRKRWPAASFEEDPEGTEVVIRHVFSGVYDPEAPIPVLLRGTKFQLQVWRALLEIPPGGVTSYGEVARGLGAPTSARPVGTAIGANRIAFLIPCHRVIPATAALGNYRWGSGRKKAILAWERALSSGVSAADPAI